MTNLAEYSMLISLLSFFFNNVISKIQNYELWLISSFFAQNLSFHFFFSYLVKTLTNILLTPPQDLLLLSCIIFLLFCFSLVNFFPFLAYFFQIFFFSFLTSYSFYSANILLFILIFYSRFFCLGLIFFFFDLHLFKKHNSLHIHLAV